MPALVPDTVPPHAIEVAAVVARRARRAPATLDGREDNDGAGDCVGADVGVEDGPSDTV